MSTRQIINTGVNEEEERKNNPFMTAANFDNMTSALSSGSDLKITCSYQVHEADMLLPHQ